MKPRRFVNANAVYGLDGGNEDHDLWVQEHEVHDEVLGMMRARTSVWELTPEERAAVAAGANIELTLLGAQIPAMLETTTVPLGRSPGDADDQENNP